MTSGFWTQESHQYGSYDMHKEPRLPAFQFKNKYFPLMELPLELRRMIYREMLAPTIYNKMLKAEKRNDIEIERMEKQLAIKDSKHRANVLALNRQINIEASEIWYSTHYFKASFEWFLITIEGDSEDLSDTRPTKRYLGSVMPTPSYLPKIRNLEIHLSGLAFPNLGQHPGLRTSVILHTLNRLCQELVVNCQRLMHVIVVVPCFCHESVRDKGSLLITLLERENCMTVDEFEALVRPLRRLRVSGKMQLRNSCKYRGDHQPFFNQVAAVAEGEDPVEEFSPSEKMYWKVRERAEEFLKYSRCLRKEIHSLHLRADELTRRLEIFGKGKALSEGFMRFRFDRQLERANQELDWVRTIREMRGPSSAFANSICSSQSY
ncbi:MAG: hypothetical protein Q9216_005217 [Gyalolechia sp. 2 TL-2023]